MLEVSLHKEKLEVLVTIKTFGASDSKVGGGSGGVPEHGMNDSTAERGAMEGNPLMALLEWVDRKVPIQELISRTRTN